MGVTYKLNDEIVGFITLQKRDNPDISCRSLVAMIEEKFSLKVSKSTINAVLKQAHLSSPIGRPSQKKLSSRKFAIPTEKKIQMLTQKPEISKNDLKAPESPPAGRMKQESVIAAPLSLPKINFEKNIETKRMVPEKEYSDKRLQMLQINPELSAGPNNDCPEEPFVEIKLKWFLMLLVLRDFFSLPLLDGFFKRNTSFSQRDIDMVDVLMCFYPEVFEDPQIALREENFIIWKILGWTALPDTKEVESIIQCLNNTEISVFDFYLEIEYFLTMVASIHLVMKDGQMLIVDGRMKFLMLADENSYACPIERALFETTRLLSGKEALRLHCPEELFSSSLLEKVLTICDPNKGINQIFFNGINHQIVSQIDQISTRVERFVLNLHMTHAKFSELFKINWPSIENKITLKNKEIMMIDREMEMREIFFQSSSQQIVRFAAFCELETEFIRVTFTNFSKEEIAGKAFFNEFIDDIQNANAQDLKTSKENNLLSAIDNLIEQRKLCVLLKELLEKMYECFSVSNPFANCDGSVILKDNNSSIFVKYSQNMLKIKTELSEKVITNQLIRIVRRLFPLVYIRKIIDCSLLY